ncbi:MFS transporter [Robbsia sp. Bb-Pol-6]|uniref:MFS transporter n=1 Tax=Robbsia betulipollinis TaxID=2981849 RepID=A0ABT3ZK47_9BURK|nr:MFS transporter [Robbsia betulipollinis]MCY0386817.1 MFS transporter [Robbsia betulipollinis]
MNRISTLTAKPVWMFALLYVGYMISYIDRSAIALALVHIGKDFHLGPAQLGVVLSSFYLSYALMQIPGGWLADRFGSKVVVSTAIILWSFFTILTGFAWSLTSLLVIRFVFGFGEGGYPPATLKGIAEAYPRAERPKMTGFMMSSNYVGSFLAPLIIAPLIIYAGWRQAFFLMGVAGILFAIVYLLTVRRTADDASQAIATTDRLDLKVDKKALLRMPLLWKILIVWFGLSLVNKGLDAWMPTYLLTARGLNLKTVGLLVPLPFITASIATASGGWLMTRCFDGREKYLMMGGCMLTGIFLYLMYHAQTIAGVIAFQSIVYFFKSFVFATAFALPAKVLGKRLIGTGTGMINFGGQMAGFVAPLVIGGLVSHYKSYDAAFLFLVAATAVATVVSMTIHAGKVAELQFANRSEA